MEVNGAKHKSPEKRKKLYKKASTGTPSNIPDIKQPVHLYPDIRVGCGLHFNAREDSLLFLFLVLKSGKC